MRVKMGGRYQTRDGREYRLDAVDGEGRFPVQGAILDPWVIDNYWRSTQHQLNGRYRPGGLSGQDLVEILPKKEGAEREKP